MSQSLSDVFVHIVFSTKTRYAFLNVEDIKKQMYSYLGGTCNNMDCHVVLVGGSVDHVHILCKLSRNISIAKLIGEIKRESSKWIKTKSISLNKFAWQNGYGIFSIGKSEVERLKSYIINQEEHHRRKNFQEEYRLFLEEHNIEYNERYVWD